MNGARWLWVCSIILIIILGIFSWIEHATHTDLQKNLSTWVHRDITIEQLSLGVFRSGVRGLVVPTENRTTFTNDVEVGSITVEYTPSVFMKDVSILKRVTIEHVTIHWKGLLGTNIRQIIDNIKGGIPRTRRIKQVPTHSNNRIEIEEVLLMNTTIIVHIGNNTESIQLPDITIHNVHGTHRNVIKQIVEQIQTGIKERPIKYYSALVRY